MNKQKRTLGVLNTALLSAAILVPALETVAQDSASGETYTLDPFTVQGETNGYSATNSISGTRVNTRIKDIPVPITVVTEQLIEDFSFEKVEDAVVMDAATIPSGKY